MHRTDCSVPAALRRAHRRLAEQFAKLAQVPVKRLSPFLAYDFARLPTCPNVSEIDLCRQLLQDRFNQEISPKTVFRKRRKSVIYLAEDRTGRSSIGAPGSVARQSASAWNCE